MLSRTLSSHREMKLTNSFLGVVHWFYCGCVIAKLMRNSGCLFHSVMTLANVPKCRTSKLFCDPCLECTGQVPPDAMVQDTQEGRTTERVWESASLMRDIHPQSLLRAGCPVLGVQSLLPPYVGPHGNPLLEELLDDLGPVPQEIRRAGLAPTLHRPRAGAGP